MPATLSASSHEPTLVIVIVSNVRPTLSRLPSTGSTTSLYLVVKIISNGQK